uniref:receptor protein-tyrosine kinase n=1 Tax=Panagrellus redivivus TaxID=6233 RepID=A0A7E4UYN0_PANRE
MWTSSYALLVTSVLLAVCPFPFNAHPSDERCGPIDIRNSPDRFFGPRGSSVSKLQLLRCVILDGDITISMIFGENVTYKITDFPVFKRLREITGSVLVYQVKGLTTLGHMFPNLRIIGGHSLIMNYALVIYQNDDLLDLGLNKLTTIRNGGVRITENARLCFIRYINWEDILIGNIRDVLIEQGSKQSSFTQKEVRVPTCKDSTCSVKDKTQCQYFQKTVLSCWNSTTCQRICPYHRLSNGDIGPGCAENGEKCHPMCIGGCMIPNDPTSCHTCRHVIHNGSCLRQCPDGYYRLINRRCVTRAECDAIPTINSTEGISKNSLLIWKSFRKRCHPECPDGYEEDEENPRRCRKCSGYCPKRCRGGTVDSIGEAMKYSHCNIIEGHLEVEIQIGSQTTPAEKFTEAFGNIQEITDYLNVRFTPSFISLHMFKSLHAIRGQNLINNRYALSVIENPNLRQIFGTDVNISNGFVTFQNNRVLCYNKIIKFMENTGLVKPGTNVSEIDVSPFSNGDRTVCETVPLEVDVPHILSYGFNVRWTKFDTNDMDHRKFLGYQLFYKKVDKPNENMSIDDDRSACADSWQMVFFKDSTAHSGDFIVGLEPYTWYAYYVQTRIVQHSGARNGISKIGFVRTLFGAPDPPRINDVQIRGPRSIYLAWDRPLKENGVVDHYMVTWTVSSNTNYVESDNPCDESPLRHSVSLLSGVTESPVDVTDAPDTCPADRGCCKCADKDETGLALVEKKVQDENPELTQSEKAKFENAVQNLVPEGETKEDESKELAKIENKSKAREARSIMAAAAEAKNDSNDNETFFKPTPTFAPVALNINSSGKVNVSTLNVVLHGLHHFTEYRIVIFACQDVREKEASCTPPILAATKIVRTDPLPEKDLVARDSVTVDYDTADLQDDQREKTRRIRWKAPDDPNGILRAFKVKVSTSEENTPIEQCVPYSEGVGETGVVFSGLTNGVYNVEVRTVSLAGVGNSTIIENAFEVNVPPLVEWYWIVAGVICLLFIIFIFSYIGNRSYFQMMLSTKMREYLQQTISANPDYLSTMDVYTPDEWEVKREMITIYEEIGRGTFGKVYRGVGNSITSVSGVKFGRCAIKTVADSATQAERLHFLIEASVMKLFNTAFVIKLLGVVSSCQNLLVIMEMMELGNLRDYLRARRPNSEENVNDAPLPPMISYFKWAAQIADGMAYLEDLKFCHRDLAARNCMVTTDETVKIGDFGMARDIYYHEYYKPSGKRLMPVRWMSPESLKDGRFTSKSDVWSYGVVLYEMLTLGQQPYGGLANDQVFNYIGVKRGVLLRPVGCPDYWYDLMRTCWKYDARDRPAFYQIFHHLKTTIETIFKDPRSLEEAQKVFDVAHCVNHRKERLEDSTYDFEFKEEVMNLPQNHLLEGLENEEQNQISSDQRNFADLQYYKTGFDAEGTPRASVDEGDPEEGQFQMKVLKDLKLPDKKMREALMAQPEIIVKRTKDKDKDKPKEKERKKASTTNGKAEPISRERQIAEAAEKAMQNLDSTAPPYQPMENINEPAQLHHSNDLRHRPKSSDIAAMEPVAVHIRQESDKSLGGGSRYRPPETACNDLDYENEANQEKRPLNPK